MGIDLSGSLHGDFQLCVSRAGSSDVEMGAWICSSASISTFRGIGRVNIRYSRVRMEGVFKIYFVTSQLTLTLQ